MATEQIKVTSTSPNASTSTKTITYTNPEATNEQLKQLGQKLNAFTDNTYGKTDRVITINCDTESGDDGKQTPTLSLAQSSCSVADISAKIGSDWSTIITTDSDGAFYVKFDSSLVAYTNAAWVSVCQNSGQPVVFSIRAIQNALPGAQTIIIGQAETDTYKAAEVTFTITA